MYGELLALLSAFCWAAGGAVYRKGLEYTDVWTGNFMRTSFAALGFVAIILLEGKLDDVISTLTPSIVFWLVTSAIFAFFVGDIFYLEALKRSGVARAVPVSSTYPIFVALLAFAVYGREVGALLLLGSVLVVIAIYLISEDGNGESRGIGYALMAAISWSVSISIVDYLVGYLPAEAVAGLRFLVVSAIMAAFVPVREFRFSRSTVKWLGIASMFVLVVGNYSFVEAIRLIGSEKVAPISAVYPVIAAVFARLALREELNVKIAAGVVLSFVGILLVVLS
ncbi:DMT family transporter [Archaeoglobus veneficus]|uniref:EamA domain-containing protein n=1 Tax=Archaeoglobus veneficus (strain DSM 11195 / SNP6) TaxID=693661 RepID=F2KT02_ARCVS|nr:DMT family transporter [Archaeoglobus veneficus]AEA47032.1 protein of unknown function DUF6 transmembrane [Archaeoglobus veneficus SNP6]